MSKTIRLLCADADRVRLKGVSEALRAKGVRLRESNGAPGRDDVVLAVLSEAFYADEAAWKGLLDLIGSGAENVLPLQMDGAEIPDPIKNAIYARNIIPASGRDADLVAERIVAALPKKKSRLPGLLIVGALVLIAAAGLWLWLSSRPEETVPAMAEPAPLEFALPVGITEEELAAVRCVVIVGEHFRWYSAKEKPEYSSDWKDMLYEVASADDSRQGGVFDWYWHEDGSLTAMTAYDLRFLAAMPNLEELHMANVRVAQAPDLSELARLNVIWALECEMDSVEWIARSRVSKAQLRCDVDLSPLGGSETLRFAILDVLSQKGADMSAFSPPRLEEFDLACPWYSGSIDLSGLAKCEKLTTVRLGSVSVRDLSFLEGKTKLTRLSVHNMDSLRDISAIGTLKSLRELDIEYCRNITDYSPIAGCTILRQIHLQCDDNPDAVRDASFLTDLSHLVDIGLYSCNLRNLDFLYGIADNAQKISFGFAGDIGDYSGLAAVKQYDYLHVNPRNGDASAVLPWLQDSTVQRLMVFDCKNLDLAALPMVTQSLSIRYGNLKDLTGLQAYPLTRLELWECSTLASLDGLEIIPTLKSGNGVMELEIVGCLRLTDYSALDGSFLRHLKLVGEYALPDLGRFETSVLRLESIPELRDLHILDNLSADRKIGLDLVGLDELYDLSPLRRLRGGHLIVPPQVADQAQELVDDKVFDSYEVAYPDGSWSPDNGELKLQSLDELETLPPSLLRRVRRLCLVGSAMVDLDDVNIWEDWEDGKNKPVYSLYNWRTDEKTSLPYEKGTVEDLSIFREFTGLRELRLYDQPLKSLDGIQYLSSLEDLTVNYSPALTDASPAFALQEMRFLSLKGCPITSIQGVQNLYNLCELDINNTKVTDISPLSQLDFSRAMEERDGFRLYINGLSLADYSPLSAIPVLDNLDINDADAAKYLPYLTDVEVHRFASCNSFTRRTAGDPNALFADFVRSHPKLTELWIPWNEGITDLTPLLELDGLKYVRVSSNMKKAVKSLEGHELAFEFEIEG